MMTLEQIAESIISPLWQGIDSDYKRKYSYTIWTQFEDQIRSAAYTSRLSLFLSKMTQRLGITLNERDVKRVVDAVGFGGDREVLHALRDDTALLVLMVRARAAEKFGARRSVPIETKQSQGENKNEVLPIRGADDRSLFDQP